MSLWHDVMQRVGTLRVRLVLMFSLALLPLGAVAVLQTATVIAEARNLEERNIVAQTLRSVNTERAVLRRAYGAADALGVVAVTLGPTSDACSAAMRTFVETEAAFASAGFIGMDGIMRCSSSGQPVDFSAFPDWQSFLASPGPRVSVSSEGTISGASVVIVSVPVWSGAGAVEGALSVSVPHGLTDDLLASVNNDLHLALVDRSGTVLSASTGIDDAERFERLGIVPADMEFVDGGQTLRYDAEDGTPKVAAVVPLIDDRIYVIGLWDVALVSGGITFFGWVAPIFPILMFIVTLVVANFAVDRLILRHLKRLGRTMQAYSADRPFDNFAHFDDAPDDIKIIATRYNTLVAEIHADRAKLQATIRDKEVLLREVHHRVKNNLQLIASIMNMQIRTVSDGTAASVLRRVRERVISLSALHKVLYTGEAISSVRADHLLEELIRQSLSIGLTKRGDVRTEVDLDPLELDPDQAVPLALLANELVTNAIKNVGRPATGEARIQTRLVVDGDHITLSVQNTLGETILDALGQDGTGLGTRLIGAFVGQLGATMEMAGKDASGDYKVVVSFEILQEADGHGTQDAHTDGRSFAQAS